jgi:hypothetical protein
MESKALFQQIKGLVFFLLFDWYIPNLHELTT